MRITFKRLSYQFSQPKFRTFTILRFHSHNLTMICNLDRVANPSPCEVDRSQYLRGNPNSNHKLGYETTRVLNETKSKLKAHFNNAYTSVEFTPGAFLMLFILFSHILGGGSVANKRAINGSILFHPKRLTKDTYRDKIVISSIEHKSINETVLRELGLRGYDIIKLPVDAGGRIRMDDMVKVVQQNKDQVQDELGMSFGDDCRGSSQLVDCASIDYVRQQ